MKKIIRLTESDLRKIFRLAIKENEEDWISQSQDIEGESDFSQMEKLKSNEDFLELVDFFKENPEAAEDIKGALEMNVNERYKYYDYGDNKKEITRNHYLKRKLATYGIATLFSGILGYMMGTMAGDEILKAALLMAGMGGFTFGSLASEVGREKVKDDEQITEMEDETFMRGADKNWREREDEDYGTMRGRFFDDEEDDEEWGETDRGEQNLQDLLEEARDILENELGMSIDAINEMDEWYIVDVLHYHMYNELAYDIEYFLEKEGFADEDEPYDSIGGHSVNDLKKAFAKTKSKDEELDEGWDDFVQKKRYPEDYKPEKYMKFPKGFLRKHSGRKIDPEGTILTKSDEDPFDEYMDFDDEEYA